MVLMVECFKDTPMFCDEEKGAGDAGFCESVHNDEYAGGAA